MKRLGRIRFFVYTVLTLLVLLGGARLVLSSGYVANKVADRLGASASQVRVVIGLKSRVKQVAVSGDPALLIARLKALSPRR